MVRDLTGKHALYYEAILQLRNITPEIVDWTYKEIDRVGLRVPKAKEVHDGLDLHLTDRSLTKALARKLQSTFGGEYKESVSIFSKIDGKDIYRMTILFRGMGAKKHEQIIYRGEEYEIKLIGKDILLQQTKTGKKIHVKYEEMKNFKRA